MTRPSRYEQYIFFAVVLAALLGVIFYYHRPVAVSEEAVVRSGVASDLLAGHVEGRQGLVGSLKWPPLPTMLMLPFVKIPGLGTSGLAFPIVNAIISAFTLTLLNNWWAGFRIPRLVRWALLGLYQACPPIIGAVITGSSSSVVLLLLTAGAYFLVRWLGTLDLRSLAYLGVLGGLAVITRCETLALVLLTAPLIVVRVRRSREKSFLAATLLVFLTPAVYTLTCWFLGNWLIMGDPVYFLRGVANAAVRHAEFAELQFDWTLYLMPLVLLVMTWTLSAERAKLEHWGKSVAVVIAITVLLLAAGWPYVAELFFTDPARSYFGRHHAQIAQVDEILTYLEKDCPDSKVFVSGYTGYEFVNRAGNADTYVHLMNLDLREIDRRTHGQRLLFLIPRPRGIHRWEDINLQAPWLFDRYTGPPLTDGRVTMSFILMKTWPDWHLIEVVRLDSSPK